MTAVPNDPTAELDESELDDLLAGEEPDWDAEPEPPPDVTRADSMLYRLQRIANERRRDQRSAELRRAQIDDWLHRREAKLDRQEAWLRAALERYHRAVLALDPKRLSIALPSGDLVSHLGQREWTVNDVETMAWAVPGEIAARLSRLAGAFRDNLAEILADPALDGGRRESIRLTALPEVVLSRSGLKKVGTTRDEKGDAIAWGVVDGKPIPGVTVAEPIRKFDVKLPDDKITDHETFPAGFEGGLTAEDDR